MTTNQTTTQTTADRPRTAEGRPRLPVLDLPSAISVADLADLMGVDPVDVIKQLMRFGYMISINEVVEFEVASGIAQSFGFPVKAPMPEEESGPGSVVLSHEGEDPGSLVERPPVVTILGHVDHGKTTLLDSIRNTDVVSGESGGITQHIGAYQVRYNGTPITFLDTPGHEAFTAMRARGAKVTDIAILVVAADDGIMPQTQEAIDHVKAAGVPIIVAVNKIDRPDADPDRVKRQLAERDLLVEDWGGEVIAVPVSALKGEGIDDLLENIIVVSEIAELRANPDQLARGVVVEAEIDKSKGPVATVLVQTGTLKPAQTIVVNGLKGRVRAMLNDRGNRVKQAGPSMPVEILGIGGLPDAGDAFTIVADERAAREMVEEWERTQYVEQRHGTLEDIAARIESGEVVDLDLIVKTDVQGSTEAVRSALERLNTERTRVNIIHMATGAITENDVMLAAASDAVVIGFNTQPGAGANTLAAQEGVDVRYYDVIYHLVEDVERAVNGLLAPEMRDITEGYATVRAVFTIGRRGRAAGVYVNDGRISRSSTIYILRNNKKVHEGPIASLKHFRDDVRELTNGLEGGVVVEGFQDYQEGDILESHRIEEV
ncbi:MAG: translation initiation factor IF-2 [Chloroflexi bacterium]|nr:translation initiation factor IF-2 [Chloroflexota bacterium]